MKKLLITLLLITSLNASLLNEDDKQMHIGATTFFSFAGNALAYKELGFTRNESWFVGFLVGMTVGLAKELYDSRDGGTGFDSRDMQANAIGSIIGTTGVWTLYKFKSGK